MTPEEVATLYTSSSLIALRGDADYKQFSQTCDELVRILAKIPTSYGGGQHGLIALAFTVVDYEKETGRISPG